jgi:uncharacterized protein YkvS
MTVNDELEVMAHASVGTCFDFCQEQISFFDGLKSWFVEKVSANVVVFCETVTKMGNVC